MYSNFGLKLFILHILLHLIRMEWNISIKFPIQFKPYQSIPVLYLNRPQPWTPFKVLCQRRYNKYHIQGNTPTHFKPQIIRTLVAVGDIIEARKNMWTKLGEWFLHLSATYLLTNLISCMPLCSILQSDQDLHLHITTIRFPKDRDNNVGKVSYRNPILVNGIVSY